MAKLILVANWKNRPASLTEARDILKGYSRSKETYKKLAFFIAPPYTYFESASERSFANLAAQNISSLPAGSYTGQITNELLKSFGVKLAIIGHSERRKFGEMSEHIAMKVRTALRSGIAPLVCVGEAERDSEGEYYGFLREQIKSSLAKLSRESASKILVAYEPVWAIGKSAKNALSPRDLGEMVIFIKKVLSDLFGRSAADKIPILYGGSVEPANAEALVRGTGIRGFLVGHESLRPKELEQIAHSLIQK